MQLEDWLDDLCVRFIINLPPEELESVERICFQVEEAQWFYEDFIRPLDPSLPSLPLRAFSLRIFQHCPLFAQWDAHHFTTAFAEFMAYKSRVPVRGAIMLNEAMDEVVLVKGWKKGANWSFPRGKINKDEDDLDCAIREVYEETGFDVREAGLVKETRDTKYIEITMREQHMKLYVFRGVPQDTHFEPRTRKEISKIEWYKLTDLPTLKKHKHKDSNGNEHGLSANKFYMVAPFLGPLKKWIAQVKKKEGRYSSHLAAPPVVAEESEIEVVPEHHDQDQIPSDLPEVTLSRSRDASQHLKNLFGIGSEVDDQTIQPPPQQPSRQPFHPTHMPQVDAEKSSALLALLRTGSTAEMRASPQTPFDQSSFPPQMPRSPHHSNVRAPQEQGMAPPPHLTLQSELPTSPPMRNISSQSHQMGDQPRPPPGLPQPSYANAVSTHLPGFPVQRTQLSQPMMPYQQTGDPEFALQHHSKQDVETVPPASALPKLNSHTKSLLDMFKGTSPVPQHRSENPPPNTSQNLLNMLNQQKTSSPPSDVQQNIFQHIPNAGTQMNEERSPLPAPQQPRSAQQNGLLQLFGQSVAQRVSDALPLDNPVELSATPKLQDARNQQTKEDVLLELLKQQKAEKAIKRHPQGSGLKEGETSATLSSPLNQPNFEVIPQRYQRSPNGMGRSPLTTHRTLFDPNQPTPVRIMSRPGSSGQQAPKSPRATKNRMAAGSPKRPTKAATKEQLKSFHPQILKRPQTSEGPEQSAPAEPAVQRQASNGKAAVGKGLTVSSDVSSEQERVALEPKPAQVDNHKQNLLSLFGGSHTAPNKQESSQTPSRVVSPLSTGQIISPKDDVPVSAIDPYASRSRMGSLASMKGGPASGRPAIEKRQTTAEDKQFLLGFLGKIASQDG